jgi:hypothetical protein
VFLLFTVGALIESQVHARRLFRTAVKRPGNRCIAAN